MAPKLVVECLSPSNRKGSVYQLLADYESASAAEVWLIDPKRRIVAPYVLEEGQLVQRNGIGEGALGSVALPVQIDVSRLWQAFETGR